MCHIYQMMLLFMLFLLLILEDFLGSLSGNSFGLDA